MGNKNNKNVYEYVIITIKRVAADQWDNLTMLYSRLSIRFATLLPVHQFG